MYVFCKHTLCKAHYWTSIEVFPSTDISGLQQIENICAKSENFVHRGKNPHGSRQQAASHRTAGPRWEAAYYLLLFILNSVFLFDLFTACLSRSLLTHTHARTFHMCAVANNNSVVFDIQQRVVNRSHLNLSADQPALLSPAHLKYVNKSRPEWFWSPVRYKTTNS